MTIQFQHYSFTNRVPGVYAEVNNSNGNTVQAQYRTLIIGQMLGTTGLTGVPNVPVISNGPANAAAIYGNGSMLADMVATYQQNDTFGELWELPLADDSGSTKASANVSFLGTATVAGTFALYVAGDRFPVGVSVGDTDVIVATNVCKSLCQQTLQVTVWIGTKQLALTNATTPLLCTDASTATIASATPIVFKYLHGCIVGNDTHLRLNYGGAPAGEVAPVGIAPTVTGFSGGTVNPSLTTALANLGAQTYDFIIVPFNDTVSLNAIQNLLNDTSGRWAWSQSLFGHAFAAIKGTLGTVTTFGVGRDDQHMSVLPMYDTPSPTWEIAAAFGAQVAISQRADPALPVTQVPLIGIYAPPIQNRFQLSDRNTLLYDGLSTYVAGNDGVVYLERVVTTYQTQPVTGAIDSSYLDVETMGTLAWIIRDLRAWLSTTFARSKLVSDATKIVGSMSGFVTPNLVRLSVIQRYRYYEGIGIVQNGDIVCPQIAVENRGNGFLAVLLPPDLCNQLRGVAVLVKFNKS